MTMALGSTASVQELRKYEVGDTITLAEVVEEKLDCKVVCISPRRRCHGHCLQDHDWRQDLRAQSVQSGVQLS
jgi:hypothetical protein